MDKIEAIKNLRFQYARASKLTVVLFLLSLTVSLPAIASIFVVDTKLNYGLALINVVLVSAWLIVNRIHMKFSDAAKVARRASMVLNSLGGMPSPIVVSNLHEQLPSSLDQVDGLDAQNYYLSSKEPGKKRMIEIVEECAFYSRSTHAASAKFLYRLVFMFLVLFIASIALAIPNSGTDQLMLMVRAFLALTLFFLSSDVLGRAILHKRTERDCDKIVGMCISASEKHLDAEMLLLSYVSSMESAPETLPFLYTAKFKSDLEKNYDRRIKSRN